MVISVVGLHAVSFQQLMNELLHSDTEYQELILKYDQEAARYKLQKSLNILDLNASYEGRNNELDRTDTTSESSLDTEVENSDITESDARWKVELSKQLFPKDYDDTDDTIDHKLKLARLQQELTIARLEISEEIIDDFLDLWEAEAKIEILEEHYVSMQNQYSLMKELSEESPVETKLMIGLLEDLDKFRSILKDYYNTRDDITSSYSVNLDEFMSSFAIYVNEATLPEAVELAQGWEDWRAEKVQQTTHLSSFLKRRQLTPYLPEINLSLSWNWRETTQDWGISQDDEFDEMRREQTESYPELKIEFSLPFDIVRSTSAKRTILRNYNRQVEIAEHQYTVELEEFARTRINSYRSLLEKERYRNDLAMLFQKQLQVLQNTHTEISSTNDLDLLNTALKCKLAEIDALRASYELHKESYLLWISDKDAK